jgi:hypothetical protein
MLVAGCSQQIETWLVRHVLLIVTVSLSPSDDTAATTVFLFLAVLFLDPDNKPRNTLCFLKGRHWKTIVLSYFIQVINGRDISSVFKTGFILPKSGNDFWI